MRKLLPFLLLSLAFAQATAPTAGTYDTKVKLVDDTNTCGAVEVRDNPTTFANIDKSKFEITHSGTTYVATVSSPDKFAAEQELKFNDFVYVISIKGTFGAETFQANVDVKQTRNNKTCNYSVKWEGKLRDQPVFTQPLHRRPDDAIRFDCARDSHLQEVSAEPFRPAVCALVQGDHF